MQYLIISQSTADIINKINSDVSYSGSMNGVPYYQVGLIELSTTGCFAIPYNIFYENDELWNPWKNCFPETVVFLTEDELFFARKPWPVDVMCSPDGIYFRSGSV